MAKPQKTKKAAGLEDIELHSDAWDRFENFVKTKLPTRSAIPIKSKARRPKAGKSK